jgi:drug/metabolite transporter (DMT)-like permease
MRTTRVYAVFCLVCAIFGTTFLAIKLGVGAGAPPFLFAGIRFAAAGLVLGAALLASGRASLRSLAALAPRAALLSILYIVANFGATFWAEQYIASSTAAQIDAVGPIASAILSSIFLGKRLRLSHLLGIAAGFAGVWLIVRGVGGGAAVGQPGGRASVAASIVMLGGAIGFAGSSVLYRRLFDDTVDSFAVNALNMLSGGIGLLIVAAATGQRAFPMTREALLPLLYLVVVGSLVGHSANLWLVKKAGPLFTSSWSYVSPVIATAVGALALDEALSPWSAAGVAATLLGVYLIARAEMRSPNAPSAPRSLCGPSPTRPGR